MLKILIRGKYSKKNDMIMEKIKVTSKAKLIHLGDETVNIMRGEIENSKSRPGGDKELEKSIKSYPAVDPQGFSVGVGKIDELAKHWRAVNYGSAHIVGKPVPGHFEGERPRAGGSGQRFTYEKRSYLITPGKPIRPHNYIERTVAKIRSLITTLFGVG